MTGYHVGLRAEALHELDRWSRSGNPGPTEEYIRAKREQAREFCDDEAVALWTRLLWKTCVRSRYKARQAPREIVLR